MDLAIDYLGVRFENPFVLSSGPPAANPEMVAMAFEMGWAGAVVKTLTREPVHNLSNRFGVNRVGKKIYAFKNIELLSEISPESWFKGIRQLKAQFPSKIVIASIMADANRREEWLELALGSQSAGADLIELNFSCPHGYPERGQGSAIGQSAEYASRITGWLKREPKLRLPVVPKLTPAVTDISFVAEAAAQAGADGFSAINTFPALLGFDLKTLNPKVNVAGYSTLGGYSGPGIKPIALRCVYDLVRNPGLPVMGIGGILSGSDAVEFILLGASVVQVCTAVLLKGYSIVSEMKKELMEFMGLHGFATVREFIGIGHERIRPFSDLDRRFTVRASVDTTMCTGCGQCCDSCWHGAYQAISMRDGKAYVEDSKCRGCSLCSHVCAVGAITMQQVETNTDLRGTAR